MVNLEKVVADLADKVERRFYGKYRGFVVENDDPQRLGRLKLRVPSALGENVVTGWALPCVPYGGSADQGMLFIPDVGAGVWVEFEEGDLEFPIWVGTFWSKPGGKSELPKANKGAESDSVQSPPTRKIIKTKKGHTIQFEDADGEEMVLIVDGKNKHKITMDEDGIKVKDGKNEHEIVLENTGINISDGVNNKIIMEQTGITVQDKNGNKIILSPSGIQIGGGATEPLVLGNAFNILVQTFVALLNGHMHLGNILLPTTPPITPMVLNVPLALSAKHKVE